MGASHAAAAPAGSCPSCSLAPATAAPAAAAAAGGARPLRPPPPAPLLRPLPRAPQPVAAATAAAWLPPSRLAAPPGGRAHPRAAPPCRCTLPSSHPARQRPPHGCHSCHSRGRWRWAARPQRRGSGRLSPAPTGKQRRVGMRKAGGKEPSQPVKRRVRACSRRRLPAGGRTLSHAGREAMSRIDCSRSRPSPAGPGSGR